jgi:uncharacterized membrane protein
VSPPARATALSHCAAIVTAGLVAGLFFLNASTVMPAPADVDDRHLTSAINVPLTDDLVAAEPTNASEFATVGDDFEDPFDAGDIARPAPRAPFKIRSMSRRWP